MFLLILAVIAGVASALSLYVGSSSQKLLQRRLSLGRSLALGAGLAAVSLILFLQVSGPAASIFILMTLVMAVWSALPFVMSVARPGRKGRT